MNREDIIRGLQQRFRQAVQSLNERQRRHWAASEAITLGRGGITLVSEALRMSPNTIKRGMQELQAGRAESTARSEFRIRKAGGGRKPKATSAD